MDWELGNLFSFPKIASIQPISVSMKQVRVGQTFVPSLAQNSVVADSWRGAVRTPFTSSQLRGELTTVFSL